MNEFLRVLNGFPDIDQTRPDPRVADYQPDGFKANPCPIQWADYRTIKTILLNVLGSRIYELLFRVNRKVDGDAMKLAASIIDDYVVKPNLDNDLQTTLITNLITKKANAVSGDASSKEDEANRLLAACELNDDYIAHVHTALFDQQVFYKPWWSVVLY